MPPMLQPRIHHPSSIPSLAASFSALHLLPRSASHLPYRQPVPSTTRSASHAAQGRANGPTDSAGRRLGAKKSASEYVVPGNIIFRQRGTKWHPGENVGLGKDHTIYALMHGYVRYYRDPGRDPKKRYIGVALEREGKRSVLPTPANAPRRRRLGMVAVPMARSDKEGTAWLESHLSENSTTGVAECATVETTRPRESETVGPRRGPHQPPEVKRVSNYEVGKAMEKNAASVRPFDRSDRWLAWRKRSEKIKRNTLARAAKAGRKSKGKKTNTAVAGRPGKKR